MNRPQNVGGVRRRFLSTEQEMVIIKSTAAFAGLAIGALALTGCSVVNPDTSQVALHYSGGFTVNNAFVECIAPGQRETNSANEQYFYYPHGQRTLIARTGPDGHPAPGAEQIALQIPTKGADGNPGPLVGLDVSITFQLREDCTPYTDNRNIAWPGGHLQKFNDTIGRQLKAYVDEPDTEPGPGWDTFMTNYIGGPAAKAFSVEGLGYTAVELYSDAAKRADFLHKIETAPIGPDGKPLPSPLQTLIDQQMGDHFIDVINVQVGAPELPPAMLDQIGQLQVNQQKAANAQINADTAKNWPGGVQGYQDYLARQAQIDNQQAVNDAIRSGRVQAIPVPYGSAVIVGGK